MRNYNMKKILFFVSIATAAAFMSCGNETDRLKHANDSIENVNNQQRDILNDLTETLVEVSTSLDSIAAGEGLLKKGGEGKTLTRQQVIANLTSFKQMLAENREKLNQMEKQLSTRNDQISKLSALIKHLNNELDEREATINRLEELVSNQKVEISRLNNELEDTRLAVSNLQEEAEQQREIMEEQSASMNTVYYIIGNKSTLKSHGLLTSGGLLSKGKLNMSAIDKDVFTKGNKTKLKKIEGYGKKPEIISGAPAGSYYFTDNGGGSWTLNIEDPKEFWSISKFLIIQTK